MSFSKAPFPGQLTWICGRMHVLCDLLLRKSFPLQGTGLVQNLKKSPAPSLLPTTLLPSSPSRSSLPGAAVLTEMGSLTPCIPLSSEPSVVFAKEQPARSEVQAVAGASATLNCEVAQAQMEVTWYKDGKKLSSSSKVRVEAKGCTRRLVVQQAGKADAGEYSCEAGGQKVSFRLDVTGQSFVVLSLVRRWWLNCIRP